MFKHSKTHIAIPPGETIREMLEDRGMSQKEFAKRMDLSEKHVSKLINGHVGLSCEVAERLELVLGMPATFWNNLEKLYKESLAKVDAENKLERNLELVKKYSYDTLANLGWLPKTVEPLERVRNLCKFFEVASLTLIPKVMSAYMPSHQSPDNKDKDLYAQYILLQKAKLDARKNPDATYDPVQLMEKLEAFDCKTKPKLDEFVLMLREDTESRE